MAMNARDLAATALFIPTYQALYDTFQVVLYDVVEHYPTSKDRNARIQLEFWADANVYWDGTTLAIG